MRATRSSISGSTDESFGRHTGVLRVAKGW